MLRKKMTKDSGYMEGKGLFSYSRQQILELVRRVCEDKKNKRNFAEMINVALDMLMDKQREAELEEIMMSRDFWDNDEQCVAFQGVIFMLINNQMVTQEQDGPASGTRNQILIPVILHGQPEFNNHELSRELPPILIHQIGTELLKRLGVSDSAKLSFCPVMLTSQFFNKSFRELFLLSEGLFSGTIRDQKAPQRLGPDGFQVFYIYAVLMEEGKSQFSQFKNEIIRDCVSTRDWREDQGAILERHYQRKGFLGTVTMGHPGFLIDSLYNTAAYMRESNLWNMINSSMGRGISRSDLVVINQESGDNWICIRMFDGNRCTMVFDYGKAMVRDTIKGGFQDRMMIEDKLRHGGFTRFLHTNEEFDTRDIDILVDRPLLR